MPVTGELVLDFSTYRRIALAPSGPGRWLARIMGAVILLCVGGLALSGGGVTAILLAFVGLMLVFAPELLVLLGWQQTRGLTAGPWRYEITDSGLGVHTARTSARVDWDGISRGSHSAARLGVHSRTHEAFPGGTPRRVLSRGAGGNRSVRPRAPFPHTGYSLMGRAKS